MKYCRNYKRNVQLGKELNFEHKHSNKELLKGYDIQADVIKQKMPATEMII
ncbi:hypothetical protein [Clostridium sp.]